MCCLISPTHILREVRKCILKRIGLSKYTVPELALRARDIDPAIRETVFKILKSADIALFEPRVSLQLLRDGVADPVPAVQDHCKKMLLEWYNKSESLVEV